MANRVTLKIDLTPQQREQVRQAMAKEAPAMNLTSEVLEDRAAPWVYGTELPTSWIVVDGMSNTMLFHK